MAYTRAINFLNNENVFLDTVPEKTISHRLYITRMETFFFLYEREFTRQFLHTGIYTHSRNLQR